MHGWLRLPEPPCPRCCRVDRNFRTFTPVVPYPDYRLQITHPPPYLYGLVILVAALELLALPPVEMGTACGTDAETAVVTREPITAGESATMVLRPTRAGTYAFYCDKKLLFFPSHREKEMEGQIEVTAESG